MKAYKEGVVIFPDDPTTRFLFPVCDAFLEVFPNLHLGKNESNETLLDEISKSDFVVFLGHGSPSSLNGCLNLQGEKTQLIGVEEGIRLLDGLQLFILACKSFDFIKKIGKAAHLPFSFGFGDMPTDWQHVQFLKDMDPDYLGSICEEHISYYKEGLVSSIVSGIEYSSRSFNFLNIKRGIGHKVSGIINDIIFNQEWDRAVKLQLIQLFIEFRDDCGII